ncbi:podocalyxin like protein [Willisornis vidua]|uniref:Podocalyxin n=4 Tax=Telluraves TaxID=3073808 RepID=A0ABQ9DNY0_9PASS|nr:podocalyxin like protein [Willisornis vidua]
MRAPGLLPLLPLLLLLLGVSSQDETVPESPEKIATTATTTTIATTITTTDTSKMKESTTAGSAENPASPSKSSATVQTIAPTTKPVTPPSSVKSSTPAQSPTPTSLSGTTSSLSASPSTAGPGTTTTANLGIPPPAPTPSLHTSQQVSTAASSGASTASPAATSTAAPNQPNPPDSLGSLGTTTTTNPVLTHGSSFPTTSGGLGAATTPTHRLDPQGGQPLDHSTHTTVSSGVLRSSPDPGAKDSGVPSSTPATKHPHSSSSSPVQDLDSSTGLGGTKTSVTPLSVSLSHTTSKTSLTSPPGSIHKISQAATTLTPVAEDPHQGSHDAGPTSAKPTSASQGPASAQPPPPAPGDQTVPGSPGHQHLNTSLHNEVICKDAKGAPVDVQNNWLTMYLKEAKTCDEWRTASANISFFESLCSTSWHVFNASRETCTVTLMSYEPQSQHWAMHVVLHGQESGVESSLQHLPSGKAVPLHPEHILEELEKKDKLEELGIGIANITSDKADKDMIINDEFSTPLIITIVTLAGSLLLVAAIYGCCHQRFSQKKDQQRLTEELQTMENGYHDNPTLEVMETSSEMQEKKVNLNGELGDSWIVPLDTLMKEDLEEEEDTHL